MARFHEIDPTPERVHWGYFASDISPTIEIESGDIVTVHTLSGEPHDMPSPDSGYAILPHHLHARLAQTRSDAVASDKPPQDDLNAQMLRGAEQMRQQTQNAIDGHFGLLLRSIASMPSGGTDLGEKLKAAAEKSIVDTHRFLTGVSQAKDFAELMSLQSEFMQAQIKEFSKHLQFIGEAYAKSAEGVFKEPRPINPPRE